MLPQAKLHRAARPGEFHGIVDQDPQKLEDRVLVAEDRRIRQADVVEAPVLQAGSSLAADGLDQRSERDRDQLELLSGIGLGQRQQMFHQAAHPLAFGRDVTHGGHADVVGDTGAVRQQFRIAADRGERRPQLV